MKRVIWLFGYHQTLCSEPYFYVPEPLYRSTNKRPTRGKNHQQQKCSESLALRNRKYQFLELLSFKTIYVIVAY